MMGNVVGKREFLRFCMSDETYMLGFMGGDNGATCLALRGLCNNAQFRTLIFQHACYKVKYGLAFWPYFASNRRLVEKFCLIKKV
jgi:hypothetical protein